MNISLILTIVTLFTIVASVLLFPTIKVGAKSGSTYWIVALVGAIAVVLVGGINIEDITDKLFSDSAVNPFKILTLFISTTTFSIYLDRVGFFGYLASQTLKRAKYGQISLFITLYLLVSILTIFTSNDIVILTFTPFICYFTRSAKINPIPYLVTEFVAANTWSMALIIGNPTNIYVAGANNIDFLEYIEVMILPTIASALSSLSILYLLFRKSLKIKIETTIESETISDSGLLITGVMHLIACIVMLVISSMIGVEMWLISVCFAASLFVSTLVYCTILKRDYSIIWRTLYSAPWETVPFVLSMSTLIAAQQNSGLYPAIASWLNQSDTIFSYGFASFFASNIMNNIPMSILFASILEYTQSASEHLAGAYSVIIGSNIGALLSPLGALAGVMWFKILESQNLRFSFLDFITYGIIVSIPTIFVALLTLKFILT